MKRIAQYVGLTALTLAITGCSPSSDKPAADGSSDTSGDTSAPAKTKGIIAYTPLTLSNPFFKVIGDHITAELSLIHI